LILTEEGQSDNERVLDAAAQACDFSEIPATKRPKARRSSTHRRGPYAARIAKIVARLKTQYPDLSDDYLKETVRGSFIGDISDSQYFNESVHHIEFDLLNPGVRAAWFAANPPLSKSLPKSQETVDLPPLA
jgi:hypothetical protein